MEIALLGSLILGFLLAFLFLIPRFTKPSRIKGSISTENSNSSSKTKAPRRYTSAEVSLHNQRTDCWIILKNKVYDVTSYVEEHPGGDAILNHAGEDSTEGFYGPQHGTRVFDIIDDFYVGDLEQ